MRPRWTASASAASGGAEPRVVGRRRAPAGPCRRARRRARARRRRARRRRRPARAGERRVALAATCSDRAVGLRRVGGGEHDRRRRVVVALRAQALDRARQRELRAAEALDEVAAAGDAERLQRGERVVERGEAAGDALGQHLLAGDDAVALEQQLGLRAAARGRIVVARANSGARQRPAALDLRLRAARGARRSGAGARASARCALRPRRASAAASAAARTRRWSPRPPTRGPTAPPGAPRSGCRRRRRAGR